MYLDREQLHKRDEGATLAETLKRMRAFFQKTPVFKGSKKELRAALRIGEEPFNEGYAHMTNSGELKPGGSYHERTFTWTASAHPH